MNPRFLILLKIRSNGEKMNLAYICIFMFIINFNIKIRMFTVFAVA